MFPRRSTVNTDVFIAFSNKVLVSTTGADTWIKSNMSVCRICGKVRSVELLLVGVSDGGDW